MNPLAAPTAPVTALRHGRPAVLLVLLVLATAGVALAGLGLRPAVTAAGKAPVQPSAAEAMPAHDGIAPRTDADAVRIEAMRGADSPAFGPLGYRLVNRGDDVVSGLFTVQIGDGQIGDGQLGDGQVVAARPVTLAPHSGTAFAVPVPGRLLAAAPRSQTVRAAFTPDGGVAPAPRLVDQVLLGGPR